MSLRRSLKHAWDAFRNRDPTKLNAYNYGESSYRNPSKATFRYSNDKSIVSSIYNRIAIDCASIDIRHVRLDQNGRYSEDIDDSLNQCLVVSPNLDQTPRAFRQDLYLSLFEEGYIAVVPVEADYDIIENGNYKIFELRRGRITEWFPEHVRVECYNQRTGRVEQLIMPKKTVAIIENPFYTD